jgi:RNA polymerase sigma-70 factor (ECF subfamily)
MKTKLLNYFLDEDDAAASNTIEKETIVENQEREFQKLYQSYQPKILRYLARLAGTSEAEDLCQDVFVKVSRGLKDFQGRSQISTWIYRVATNVAIDKLRSTSLERNARKESPKHDISEIEGEIQEKDIWSGMKPLCVDEAMVKNEMWNCFREFVDKLPVHYRTVVVLSDLEGFRDIEIAQILQISLETVKIRLHRGRSKLRSELITHCGLVRDSRQKIAWEGKRP